MNKLYSYFRHPNSVCMTYFQHMSLSLGFSKNLFVGSLKAYVHAIIPSSYITSTSDLIHDINKEMKNAGCCGKQDPPL
jgi:hypothetical protein